jgi:flagellar assembly factor FliW
MTTAATTSSTPISVPSQALGSIEVRPDTIITFCEPLAGFPDCTQYALIEHTREGGSSSAGSVFWLQAVERPFHAFVVTDPWGVNADYAPEISDADAGQLDLGSFEDARVFGILTVPRSPSEITINLRAPVVVNVAQRLAKQVVVLNDEYHTRHPMNRSEG